MRISDWSSDVCSSDLGDADSLGCDADATGVEYAHGDLEAVAFLAQHLVGLHDVVGELDLAGGRGADAELGLGLAAVEAPARGVDQECGDPARGLVRVGHREQHDVLRHRARSEEHTSELPSLMRISYAVFCLKKKKQNKHKSTSLKH